MAVLESRLLRRQGCVDGRWVDADSGETFPITDPATAETIAEGREGSSYGIDEWLELKYLCIGGIGEPIA